jgi:arylformamidase
MNDASSSAKVYLHFTQEELRREYNPSLHTPNRDQVLERIGENSAATCTRIGAPTELRYGEDTTDTINLYRCERAEAPVHIHFHGGGWRWYDSNSLGAFMAETYLQAGAHLALPYFAGVDQNGGNMRPIADQVRKAIVWLYRNAHTFGGDPSRLYLSGHSSGAHLASVVATTDWSDFGLDAPPLQGVMCVSGLYDLVPMALSKNQPMVNFDEETITSLSSVRYAARLTCPLVLAYAVMETDEFKRQAKEFASAASDAGKTVKIVEIPSNNHFEIIESIGNPYGFLGIEMLELMGLR